MRFMKRTDTDAWLGSGGCPFYFHALAPRCAVTRMALGGRDVFEDEAERAAMSEHDCGGNMHGCPYVAAMWDVPAVGDDAVVGMDMIGHRGRVFALENVGIDVYVTDEVPDPGYSVAIIPTTRLGAWRNMGHDHGWDAETCSMIDQELALYTAPFDIGQVIATRGWGSGHTTILHAVVFDDVDGGGGLTPVVIQSALVNALEMVDRADPSLNIGSVEIRPLCIPLPDGGSLPDTWHVVAMPITSILSFRRAGRLASCDRYRIDIPRGGLDLAVDIFSSLMK